MEIDIKKVEDRDGCILEFHDGATWSSFVFLSKKDRYKLQQLLIEEQLKEI